MRDFLVVQQGSPSALYYGFDGGTVLLMNAILLRDLWHGSNVNDYENSRIHGWLNNGFMDMLDESIQNQVKQVRIPFRPGAGISETISSGENGLLCKAFLLSGYEVGSGIHQHIIADGTTLSYFIGIETTVTGVASSRRSAMYNGTNSIWWLRTPNIRVATAGVWTIHGHGNLGDASLFFVQGIRPALVLPDSLVVSDGEVVLSCNCTPSVTEPPTTESPATEPPTTEPPTTKSPDETTPAMTREPGASEFTPELANQLSMFIDFMTALGVLGLIVFVFVVVYRLFRIFF
jgi:hypothetical protein